MFMFVPVSIHVLLATGISEYLRLHCTHGYM